MARKDLSVLREQPLVIDAGGGIELTVPPPTNETRIIIGRVLSAAGTAVATASKTTSGKDVLVSELGQELFDEMNEPGGMERAALGDAAYEQAVEAGIPARDISSLGRYAAFYWSFGEAMADQLMLGGKNPLEDGATFPKQSKSGQSTGSENQDQTAHTSATENSPSTSAKSSTPKNRKPRTSPDTTVTETG